MAALLPSGFHFLRPEWLFFLIPSLLFFILFLVLSRHNSQWRKAVNRDLLPHLLDGGKSGGRSALFTILFIAWTIGLIAMAGPAWTKLPQPVHEKEDALVIIQDLSLSFFAQDLSPDRLTRARRKLVDILKQRKEGTTALIAYSADAHTIVPLTDDMRTIENMVPALSPSIMPGYGSNVVAAVRKGLELLKNATISHGRMLLLTDEVTADDLEEITDILNGRSVTLSIIGVGTENGGPVPRKDGGFWKDKDGTIIVPKMNRSILRRLAEASGGRYSDITLTDSDFEYVLAEEIAVVPQGDLQRLEREFDTWQDMGSRLVVLIIPLALLAFRRGLIIGILFIIMFAPGESHAMSWTDLWLTPDQQAARAMRDGDYKKAADMFKAPLWKGAANYRASDYKGAADVYSGIESSDGYYNKGNALAKSGDLPAAIEAYNKALELEPEMKDALHNRELVKKLLEQQQKQQSGDTKDSKDSGKNQQNGSNDDQGKDGQKSDGKDDPASGKEQQEQQEKGQQGDSSEDKEAQERSDSSNAEESADGEQGKDQKKDMDSVEKSGGPGSAPEPRDQSEIGDKKPERSIVDGKRLPEEERQAVEQLLRKIPDDPGGLLRRKFEYEFQQNQVPNNSNKNNKIW